LYAYQQLGEPGEEQDDDDDDEVTERLPSSADSKRTRTAEKFSA
jgi:hypothetical protein